MRRTWVVLMAVGSGLAAMASAHADDGAATLRCKDGVCTLVPEGFAYPLCATIDVASARRAVREHADVRTLIVAANGAALEKVLAARWVGDVEQLRACTDERGLRAIARSTRLRKLTDLIISSSAGIAFDPAAVRALVGSAGLRRRLRRLVFAASDSEAEQSIDGAGLRELARARGWRLKILDVSWNYGIRDGIDALVHSPLAKGLEQLRMCESDVFPEHVDAIVDANLTGLTRLCVPEGQLADGHSIERLQAVYGDALRLYFDEP